MTDLLDAPGTVASGGIGFERMVRLLADRIGLDPAAATPEAQLEGDLGWDSLTFLEVLALADDLGLRLPDALLGSLRTLGDVHHYLDAHLRHSAEQPAVPPTVLALRSRVAQLVPVTSGHEELLWRLHTNGTHLVDHRLRGRVPSPEQFHRLVWEGVLAQFLVATTDGRVVGLVSAFEADLRNGHAHVGVVSDPDWRSSGVALDGLVRLVSHLFAQFDLRKVYAEVLERNLERFGSGEGRLFTVEARFKEHEYIDGGYEDLLVLATDRATWRDVHQRLVGEPANF